MENHKQTECANYRQLRHVRDIRNVIPKRYVVAILLFLGFLLGGWMKLNFYSTVILPVTLLYSREEIFFSAVKNWTTSEAPLVEISYLLGYAAGQIPSALLVLTFSAHRMMTISVALSSLLHIIMPMALHYHIYSVISVHVLTGLTEAAFFPACIGLLMQWTPPSEKSRIFILVFSGSHLAPLISASFTSHYTGALDADVAFYIVGIIGLAWCLLWSWIAYDSPSLHPNISRNELSFLEESISPDVKVPIIIKSIPVKSIVTCLPVWAICAINIGYTCFSEIRFLTHIFLEKFVLSSTIYTWGPLLLLLPICGLLTDVFINKNLLSVIHTRKILVCGALGVVVISAVISNALRNFIVDMPKLHLAFYIIQEIFLGFIIPALAVNCVDIGSRYAGILMAVGQTLSTLSDVLVLQLVVQLANHSNIHLINWVECLVYAISIVIFGVFSSGDVQKWTIPSNPRHPNSANDAQYFQNYPSEENEVLVTDSV